MIKDKIQIQPPPIQPSSTTETTEEEVSLNPFIEIYKAVKKAILTIKEDQNNPSSPALFKTVCMDNGQFDKLSLSQNTNFEIAFPAVFIHFVNIRYLVQQQRIGEGRATMRVRFVLNDLNNHDEDVECRPFEIFQLINVAIQDAKNTEPALNERCNLTYFDTPLMANMLQAFWIDYEVWFRENSAFVYRNWKKKYIVFPPFTNHSDSPETNPDNHPDHTGATYEDISKIE